MAEASEEKSRMNLLEQGDDMSMLENKDEEKDKDKGADEDSGADEAEDKSDPGDTTFVLKKKRMRRRIRRLQRNYAKKLQKKKDEEERLRAVLAARQEADKHQKVMFGQRRRFDDVIVDLEEAFGRNDLARVKELVRYRDGTSHGVDLFIHICRRGNVNVVKNLVSRLGFEANCFDVYDKTGMIFATQEGAIEMVKYLACDLKADVNFVPSHGMFSDGVSPLMIAVSNNNLALVEVLLSQNANPNQIDHRGKNCVHRACQRGYVEVLRMLISNGADMNLQDASGNSPCNYAAKFGHLETLKACVEGGADPSIANKKGVVPFHRAASRGSIEMIDYLMKECGVSINVADGQGECAIIKAMRASRIEVVKYLALETRTNINAKDKLGRSPVLLAVVLGNLELVSFFTLECREFIDQEDWALVYKFAVKQEDIDMIRHLIFNCGYILQEEHIESLHLWTKAAEKGDIEMAQVIVKSLGDKFEIDKPDAEDPDKNSALMIATKNDQLEMVRYLVLDCKAGFNKQNAQGNTPVLLGVKHRVSWELLDFLINHDDVKVDLFITDNDGNSVFDVALDMGVRGRNMNIVHGVLVEFLEHTEGLARFLAGEKDRKRIQFLFGMKQIREDTEILKSALEYVIEQGLELDAFVLLELKKATNKVTAADKEARTRAERVLRTRAVAKSLMMEMENDPGFHRSCTNIIKGALTNFRPFSDDMLIAVCMYERKHYLDKFSQGEGVLAQLQGALAGSIESGKGSHEYKWLNAYLLDSAAWFERAKDQPFHIVEEKEEEKAVEVREDMAEQPEIETRGRGNGVDARPSAIVGDGAVRRSSKLPGLLSDEATELKREVSDEIDPVQAELEAIRKGRIPCLFVDMLLKKYESRMDEEGRKLSEHVFESFAEEAEDFDNIRQSGHPAKFEQWRVDRQDELENGIKADKSEMELGYNDKNIQFYDLSVNMNQLVSFANQINDEFQEYIERILKAPDGLPDDIYSFRRAPVKTMTRCREKCETDYFEEQYPTSARLLDLVRCSVTFKHVKHLEQGMHFFLGVSRKEWDPEDKTEGIRGVARIKNGLAELGNLSREEPIGYKDIKINAIYFSKIGKKEMIVEIQMILKPFLMAKKHMHRLYKVIRQYDVFRIAIPMAEEMSMKEKIYEDEAYGQQ